MKCGSNPKRLAAIALVVALLSPAAPALAAPAGDGGPLAWLSITVEKLTDWALGWWGVASVDSSQTRDGAGMDPDGRRSEKQGLGLSYDGPTSSSSLACGDEGPGMDPNGHCSS